jgi:hypothetical protein
MSILSMFAKQSIRGLGSEIVWHLSISALGLGICTPAGYLIPSSAAFAGVSPVSG